MSEFSERELNVAVIRSQIEMAEAELHRWEEKTKALYMVLARVEQRRYSKKTANREVWVNE